MNIVEAAELFEEVRQDLSPMLGALLLAGGMAGIAGLWTYFMGDEEPKERFSRTSLPRHISAFHLYFPPEESVDPGMDHTPEQ